MSRAAKHPGNLHPIHEHTRDCGLPSPNCAVECHMFTLTSVLRQGPDHVIQYLVSTKEVFRCGWQTSEGRRNSAVLHSVIEMNIERSYVPGAAICPIRCRQKLGHEGQKSHRKPDEQVLDLVLGINCGCVLELRLVRLLLYITDHLTSQIARKHCIVNTLPIA